MLTMVVLVVLCVGALVPQAMRSRTERHQEFLDSIRFHAAMGETLSEPAAQVQPRPHPDRSTTIAQRRTLFVVLLVSVVLSALAAVLVPGKVSLVVHLAVDDCFLAYVAQLVRWRDARQPVATTRVPTAVPDLVLGPSRAQPVLRVG